MRISRIYLPLQLSSISHTISVEGDKAHYIRNVLRLKVGFTLHFFIPNGNQYQCRIGHISKHQVDLIDICLTEEQPENSILNTTIAQGISSSDRMDYSIQKAAEMGCQKVIPFVSDFCSQKIPEHKFEKKLAHWQAVAISACEQSGRSHLMTVAPIHQLVPLVQSVENGVYLDVTAEQSLHHLPKELQQEHSIFIGPEGGFSENELALFKQAGYFGVQLGHRVLRTETVAPVIMGAMHTLYGDFKPLAE